MSNRSRGKRKIIRAIKKIITAFLAFIMFVSFFTGFMWISLYHAANSGGELSVKIADPGYCDKVYDEVYASLEKKMGLVVVKPDDISDIITKEVINEEAPYGVMMLTSCLFGEEYTEWEYKNEKLLERITEVLSRYAADNGIEFEDGSAEAVYEMVCETITSDIRILSPNYAEKIYEITSKYKSLLDLWFIPLLIWAVCGIVIAVMAFPHKKSSIYNIILPTYLGSFSVFAVSAIMYAKDYFGRTVVGGSILGAYIRGLYSEIFYEMRQTSLVATVALLAGGLMISIVLALGPGRKRRSRRVKHVPQFEGYAAGDVEIHADADEIDLTFDADETEQTEE